MGFVRFQRAKYVAPQYVYITTNKSEIVYKDKNISKTLSSAKKSFDFTVRRELYLSSQLAQVINSIRNFHTRDLIKRYEENASGPKYVIPYNVTLTCNAQRSARANDRIN